MPIHNNIKSIVAVKRVLANSLALGSFVGLVVATTLSQNSITSVDVMASGNPFGTSIRFHGTGTGYNDRVEIPVQGNKLNIGATDFTIEFWMKVPLGVINTPVGGGNGWIWGNIILDRDIYGNHPNDFGLSLFNGNLRFGTGPNPDTNTIQTSGVNVADGLWHHVAIVRVASTGQVRIYVDGTQRASGNLQAGDISYSGSHSGYINGPCNENKDPYLVLGAEKHDYFWCAENDPTKAKNNAYNGLLDDLRISDIARYNSNFTRPTLPHPIDNHTVAMYRFDDDTANDSASNPVNGEVKSGVSFDNGVVDDSCTPFDDVPTSYDFYPYICYLRTAGVVSGYPGNLYKPQNLVNRGEMAKFIYIGAGVSENTNCGNFPDVPDDDAPFYEEITSLKCAQIVSGYPQSDGLNIYKPDNNVTRGEMVKFIKRAFNIPTNTDCGNFPDVPDENAPFYLEITSLKCAGIVSGYPQSDGPNIYKPDNNVTRREMAKFVTLAMWFRFGIVM